MNWYSAKLHYHCICEETKEILVGEETIVIFKADNWDLAKQRAVEVGNASITTTNTVIIDERRAKWVLGRVIDIHSLYDDSFEDGDTIYSMPSLPVHHIKIQEALYDQDTTILNIRCN